MMMMLPSTNRWCNYVLHFTFLCNILKCVFTGFLVLFMRSWFFLTFNHVSSGAEKGRLSHISMFLTFHVSMHDAEMGVRTIHKAKVYTSF